MPSGWRSSEPAPAPNAIGKTPKIAAKVVIIIGRKRTLAASRTAWSFSWRALVGGELLIAGAASLGEQLEVGRNTANVALVLATIIIIGVIGGLFDAVLRAAETRVRRDYGLEVPA